ncbi:hypothetical protein KRZ98_09860 [Sphingobium sp. AS12]|uniref:hypothetical protein n=1 Tax=Sphingobium sp. AS12 TaxID=2849495 RepID=UPI001C31A105|nr:hypothetical protein [Sphingobium sp. AS12]MBV2148589.1 hypothetical protein [Sphingobium sp. AS12]
MTNQPTDSIVSQRAREFALSIPGVSSGYTKGRGYSDGFWIARGDYDDHPIVDAAIRFEAEIEAATIKRCAGVAEARKDEWAAAIAGGLKRVDVTKQYAAGAMTEAELLALTLRNLKGSAA